MDSALIGQAGGSDPEGALTPLQAILSFYTEKTFEKISPRFFIAYI